MKSMLRQATEIDKAGLNDPASHDRRDCQETNSKVRYSIKSRDLWSPVERPSSIDIRLHSRRLLKKP